MDEITFRKKFKEDYKIFKFWGDYVQEYILADLKDKQIDTEKFLKIPVQSRVKEESSIIEKAFYRPEKKYTNPYEQIQDKVGVRFVVLYLDDIHLIEEIIESCLIWNFSKDKDFLKEREENPEMFGYESVHYIVTSKNEIIKDGTVIPKGTPCEIQIRTLMQHAYCEMSHSIMYKRKVRDSIKRYTSRSMALIESADHFFKEVNKMVSKEEEKYCNLLSQLNTLYYSFAPKSTPEEKINTLIIDSFSELLYEDIYNDIDTFLKKTPYIQKNILKFNESRFIYSQPTVLLTYYLVSKHRKKVPELWPLTIDQLRTIYTDLGISLSE